MFQHVALGQQGFGEGHGPGDWGSASRLSIARKPAKGAGIMSKAPAPKPWIDAIHAYVPGKSAGADGRPLIKLSANENPLGTSERALEARAAT